MRVWPSDNTEVKYLDEASSIYLNKCGNNKIKSHLQPL